MTSTDVLVAGAGLAGCASALSLAQAGRRVVLVGRRESSERGLSGEWLHPGGVAALRQLGVDMDNMACTENQGFVIHPGDRQAPVTLPYPHGVALSVRHHVLVEQLQRAAAGQPGVCALLGEQVTGVAESGETVTTRGTYHPGLVVGADGRASLVRRTLRPSERSAATVSATAGFELSGTKLPTEGYGHIFLGGPGPVLAYRIDSDTVRLSMDVPPGRMRPAEMLRHHWERYVSVLPDELRAALLEKGPAPRARWAANRFRRKQFYGRSRLALVGDAVGFAHPLAAHGMTTGILDAQCLARCGDVASYARERRARCWASERLGIALHRVLTDAASAALREALFHLWVNNMDERDRMMRLLAIQEDRRTQLSLAVAHIAAVALTRTAKPDHRIRGTLDLAGWLRWLCGQEHYPLPGSNLSQVQVQVQVRACGAIRPRGAPGSRRAGRRRRRPRWRTSRRRGPS